MICKAEEAGARNECHYFNGKRKKDVLKLDNDSPLFQMLNHLIFKSKQLNEKFLKEISEELVKNRNEVIFMLTIMKQYIENISALPKTKSTFIGNNGTVYDTCSEAKNSYQSPSKLEHVLMQKEDDRKEIDGIKSNSDKCGITECKLQVDEVIESGQVFDLIVNKTKNGGDDDDDGNDPNFGQIRVSQSQIASQNGQMSQESSTSNNSATVITTPTSEVTQINNCNENKSKDWNHEENYGNSANIESIISNCRRNRNEAPEENIIGTDMQLFEIMQYRDTLPTHEENVTGANNQVLLELLNDNEADIPGD